MKVREPDEGAAEEPKKLDEDGLPSMDFAQMVLSFGTSALVHLGSVVHPDTQEHGRDLTAARQTIEMLAMLEEKTRGNLTPEEDGLLKKLLLDLRLAYAKASADAG
jgi:hypothetical protein